MDDFAFSPDDIETFAEPVAFHGRVQTSPIKPIPPLKDIFVGQTLGRLLDLLGCFARAGLAPGAHAPVEDALWLGNSLGILREFMVLKSDHRWVDSMIEALERIPGAAQVNIISRLRTMRSERWPFARDTWVELLDLIEKIGKAETQTGEIKVQPLAGKKRKKGPKLTGTEVKIIGALRVHHNLSGEELNMDPITRNALAKLADVGDGTVTRFFEKRANGAGNYKKLCSGGEASLRHFLENLDQSYPTHLLFDELKHKGTYDPDVDDEIDQRSTVQQKQRTT